jgi:hypothetical protein
VDSEVQPVSSGPDLCLLPDLRRISLVQLADRAAGGEEAVADVVSRIVHDPERPSAVSAMMFSSAI